MRNKWFLSSRRSGLRASSVWMASPWWPSDSLQIKQKGLLRLLAVSHRQGIDPYRLIYNLALENRGRYRRILNRFVRQIQIGTPVLEALEQVPDAIDDYDLLALQIGAGTDSMDKIYTELLENREIRYGTEQNIKRNLNVYFALLAVIFMLMTNFIAVFVTPILQQIHEEFGIGGRGISANLISIVSNWFGASLPYSIFLFLLIAAYIWSSNVRRASQRILAFLNPRLPSEARSQILRLMAVGIETKHSANEVLSALAVKHPSPRIRHRLKLADAQSDNARIPWQALSDNGIISRDQASALIQVDQSDAVTWCLREFAHEQTNQVNSRKNIRTRLVHPVITSVFAVLVLIVASAMISFLTEMVQALANVV